MSTTGRENDFYKVSQWDNLTPSKEFQIQISKACFTHFLCIISFIISDHDLLNPALYVWYFTLVYESRNINQVKEESGKFGVEMGGN